MPKISVIVPVYKVEQFLNRCVDSILSQSFSDFQLILVDDGSPDNSGAMCDAYANRDGRIHVIHQKNGGLSAARNAGLDWTYANSDAQWIAFVDSDDWLDKSFLLRMYTAVQETNCMIAACEYYLTHGQTENKAHIYPAKVVTAEEYYYLDEYRASAVACAKLYHRSLFQNIRYPVGKLHEDEFVTYRVVFEAQKVAYLSDALYAYYQNPEGIMLSKWNPRRLHILEATRQQIEFAENTNNTRFLRKASEQYIMCCQEQLTKAQPEYRKQLRKCMRYGLKKGRQCGVFPLTFDRLWAYEAAYPVKPFWWLLFKGHAFLARVTGKGKEDA